MGVPRPGGVRAEEELRALLALRLLPRLGDRTLLALLRSQGSARAVLDLPEGRFAAAAGEAAALGRRAPDLSGRVEAILERCDALGIRVVPVGSPEYPRGLFALADPPTLLFLRGAASLPEERSVAVVGARRATPVGRRAAERLGREFSEAGVTVVSGMALGIDGAAQRGALAGSGGTVAVLGSGVDRPHPTANRDLYYRILEQGLVLSEFLPGEPPRPFHFPRRNRIIAALSRAVVVVEAARRSGALGTVEHALDLGLEVFALPGSVESSQSEGTNRLIQEGAHLLTQGEDLLSSLGWEPQARRGIAPLADPVPRPAAGPGWPGAPAPDPGPRALLDGAPRSLDELAESLSLPPARVLAELTRLEVRGEARRYPEGWVAGPPRREATE